MGKIGIGKALFGWGKATSTIKNVAPTLGKLKTSEYLAKTAYKRGASKGYAEAMAEAMAKVKPKKE